MLGLQTGYGFRVINRLCQVMHLGAARDEDAPVGRERRERHLDPDFGYQISGFGYQVPGIKSRVSGFRDWKYPVLVQPLEDSHLPLHLPLQRRPLLKVRVSGFGFRISGLGFRVSGLSYGFRV